MNRGFWAGFVIILIILFNKFSYNNVRLFYFIFVVDGVRISDLAYSMYYFLPTKLRSRWQIVDIIEKVKNLYYIFSIIGAIENINMICWVSYNLKVINIYTHNFNKNQNFK